MGKITYFEGPIINRGQLIVFKPILVYTGLPWIYDLFSDQEFMRLRNLYFNRLIEW